MSNAGAILLVSAAETELTSFTLHFLLIWFMDSKLEWNTRKNMLFITS